jgi:hypothetical protein
MLLLRSFFPTTKDKEESETYMETTESSDHVLSFASSSDLVLNSPPSDIVFRRVRFLENAAGQPTATVHSYSSIFDSLSVKDVCWTSSELQDIQTRSEKFARHYYNKNKLYLECLDNLFRDPKGEVVKSDAFMDCLAQSPARGLEYSMYPVFRKSRRRRSQQLLELQETLKSQENLVCISLHRRDKLLCSTSRKISRPTRAFALKIAQGDAKVAAEYCSSKEVSEDSFITI